MKDIRFLDTIIENRLLIERLEKHLTILEIEQRRKELLMEMAYFRADFQHYFRYHIGTIIAHVGLIIYAIENNNIQNISHWKGELLTCITDVQDMETKPKSGNRDMVFKAVNEEWNNNLELVDDINKVVRKFKTKFADEGISLDNEAMLLLAQRIINYIPQIINEMAYGNESSALSFLDEIK